ncbi:MAG: hypothetical protein GWM90_31070, partial [Gemmatimonadetes bacterium]|nr:hypothetical protein [Gemmatimonadota bacterium]NIQ59655.1 hypothetical protein [Gemmatimonadota bacterium]NIU79860.1 hypothetical protein [Gammaproteobacteria bacterium]NIX48344.1 hypothetical protein [Gemmatimonadota bacterium]NIY12791.1 hypothetical protein [Gemmatimonadota bacterium]
MPEPLHLLAIVAHPDDAELLCAGTLIRAADAGHRTGVLDLTGGEAGTAGSAELRRREAARAAEIMGLATRRVAGLPDGALENTVEARHRVAAVIRELRPDTVILMWPESRHPDHRIASQLAYDAAFVAGLTKAPVARRAVPAPQGPLRHGVPGARGEADLRRGHHRPDGAEARRHLRLRLPVRGEEGDGRGLS